MLRVVVYVNSTAVAEARAGNMSELADISDYRVRTKEYGAPRLGIPESEASGDIIGHPRRTSVWGLVRKICDFALNEGE